MKKAIIGAIIIIIILSCGQQDNMKEDVHILYSAEGQYIDYHIRKIDVIFFFNEKRVLSTVQLVNTTLIRVESDDNNAYTRVKCPNTDPEIYGPKYSCKFKRFGN